MKLIINIGIIIKSNSIDSVINNKYYKYCEICDNKWNLNFRNIVIQIDCRNVCDQWDHQGRAIIFFFSHFKESVTPIGGDILYTPIQSALLAGLTALSGTPLVNTYASIAFLNMTAIFAFYYFCREWFTLKMKRAALLASTLFVLAGGFGWVYVLYSTEANPVTSEIISITSFLQEHIKFSDIILSANFMIAAYPDFSTGLIYITLPAGFLLLGLLRFEFKNKFAHTVIVSIISLTGVLFHDEFYIFIIVSSILPLLFNMRNKNSVYLAFLITFAFVYIIDMINQLTPISGDTNTKDYYILQYGPVYNLVGVDSRL